MFKMMLTLHNYGDYKYTYETYIGINKKDLLKIFLDKNKYYDICEYKIEEINVNPCLINVEYRECY